MPTDEMNLLHEYATTRSQPAFAAIVQRYVDLVYAAARRQLRGDTHLAEDVTQAVFIVLSQKASKIPADRPLSAWLLKTTGYCAANARRSKLHREHYERRAAQMARGTEITDPNDQGGWEEMSPLLDEGLNRLRQPDRDALLLKFFEKKSLRDIGVALGISEEAAAKRVTRAVDKLRDYFRRRGVAVSAAALPVMLLNNASLTAPANIASAVVATSSSAAAAATSTSAAGVAKGAMAVMAAEKVKAVALAAACVVVGLGTATAVVMKTVGSPVGGETRQVAVTPIVGQTTVEAPVGGKPFTLNLSTGETVEVLGITDDPLAPKQWWGVNGAPIAVAPLDPNRASVLAVPQQPGSRPIEIVLHFANVPPARQRALSLRPNVAGSVTRSSDTTAGGSISRYVTLVAADQKTVALHIGLGATPTDVVGNISLVPGEFTGVQVTRIPSTKSAAAAGPVANRPN